MSEQEKIAPTTPLTQEINRLIQTQQLCIWDPNLGTLRSCFEIEGAVQVGSSICINLSAPKPQIPQSPSLHQ